jgi:hypothetical protein
MDILFTETYIVIHSITRIQALKNIGYFGDSHWFTIIIRDNWLRNRRKGFHNRKYHVQNSSGPNLTFHYVCTEADTPGVKGFQRANLSLDFLVMTGGMFNKGKKVVPVL